MYRGPFCSEHSDVDKMSCYRRASAASPVGLSGFEMKSRRLWAVLAGMLGLARLACHRVTLTSMAVQTGRHAATNIRDSQSLKASRNPPLKERQSD